MFLRGPTKLLFISSEPILKALCVTPYPWPLLISRDCYSHFDHHSLISSGSVLRQLFFLSWGCKISAFYFFFFFLYGWLIQSTVSASMSLDAVKTESDLAMVIEELPLKLLPYHWHKNSILIKRETNALLTPIIALNICKTVSCSRSEIVWAAMGCLHKTLSQWIKNKIHSCSCTCSSSSLPAGLMFLHMQEHNDMKNQFYIWDMHQAKEENLMKGIVSVLLCFFHLLFWGQTWTSHVAEPMMYVRTGDPCSLSLYATFRSVLSCFFWVWLSYFTPYSIPKFIKRLGACQL